jgi:hypothetical protein
MARNHNNMLMHINADSRTHVCQIRILNIADEEKRTISRGA